MWDAIYVGAAIQAYSPGWKDPRDSLRYKDLTADRLAAWEHKCKLARLADKDGRMDRRLARHRAQISKRRWMIVGTVVFWLTAPAVALALVSEVWRVCAWVVTR